MLWRGHISSPLPFLKALGARRVNTGVWGTAPFPSIYSEDSHRLEYLPHTPAWMAVSLAFVLIGTTDIVVGTPDIRLLLVGLSGWLVTVSRCVQYASRTDLRGLPAIGGRSLLASRVIYRGLIAWLHLVQPLARIRGRIRGMVSPPIASAPEHVTRRPWKAPLPSLRDAVRTARMAVGREDAREYWSEGWVAHGPLLTELIGIVRASRPAPLVEVDEGWRPDRDFSMSVGAGAGCMPARWSRSTPRGVPARSAAGFA